MWNLLDHLPKIFVFPCRANIRRFLFSHNGATIWNALSQEVKGTVIYHELNVLLKVVKLLVMFTLNKINTQGTFIILNITLFAAN